MLGYSWVADLQADAHEELSSISLVMYLCIYIYVFISVILLSSNLYYLLCLWSAILYIIANLKKRIFVVLFFSCVHLLTLIFESVQNHKY
jgi:hypothetical protein